jgi:hypothetical protein
MTRLATKGWIRCALPPLALAVAALALPAMAADPAPASTPPDIRFVVLHHPGPSWRKGVDAREQPGIDAHVEHYRKLLARGLPDSGGMMVPAAGVSKEEITAYAAADPAVASELLEYEVRSWYVAMKRGS